MPEQNLNRELKMVHRSITRIVNLLERVAKQIDKGEGLQPKKGKARTARKKSPEIKQSVLDTIERSKKGITVGEIKSRTKLDDRQVSNALYKLTKNGYIQAKYRGVYVSRSSRS